MEKNNNINIAVINVMNQKKGYSLNKDLNGGFGTADTNVKTLPDKILTFLKGKLIVLPVISLAFLMGIFKKKNIPAEFYEGTLPYAGHDIILIYGTIVDYRNENDVCRLLKNRFKSAKVGFIGPFPSTKPKLFDSGDFVIIGDFESYFLHEFENKFQLDGHVKVKKKVDVNELPSPELKGFDTRKYRYSPAINRRPFFSLQASRGCPYSCLYYCVYAKFQGNQVILRSPQKVVADIIHLMKNYNIRGFQFRDPIFGIKKGYIEEFCEEIKKHNLQFQWGIETRLDILDEHKIELMFNLGLRNINIGIETFDYEIAKQNKRLLMDLKQQEDLISFCEKLGVKISAFYIFGYEKDTKKSMRLTLQYAKKLNTFLARFAVLTPYPGTKYFDDIDRQGRIETHDYEKYTQFNLVIKHQNLDNKELRSMLSKAYTEYYFRPQYIFNFLKWKIREFWL